jgi:hypothetical protein
MKSEVATSASGGNMRSYKDIPPVVELLWEDHYSMGDEWYEPGSNHVMCILGAVGYLVKEDDNYYYVASTYEIETGNYSSGTAVLKNCVINYIKHSDEKVIHEEMRTPTLTKGTPLNVESNASSGVNFKNTSKRKQSR